MAARFQRQRNFNGAIYNTLASVTYTCEYTAKGSLKVALAKK